MSIIINFIGRDVLQGIKLRSSIKHNGMLEAINVAVDKRVLLVNHQASSIVSAEPPDLKEEYRLVARAL